ncbi:putative type IX secretion system sortase PorU2 [Dawidia soli]|uniref:Gingipain domain-containing protein n=1 Tax=Dawidia soli TaxID=2782352 RepID=A0AAP2GJL1_9BACT|nr:C25 family cysteine peptidase [Dawidia soli]MBT1689511.1 hypothetical protein [Dawidia soli]
MRTSIAVLGVLLASMLSAYGQIGNEWINFGRPYYRIPVGKDGIYRIDYNALQAAGIPVGAVDPRTLQLFHRGAEQALYIAGEADGQLQASDYLEFYGQRNDGTLDASLYKPATFQPHQYYNIFSDTSAYFLTFGAMPGKRMEQRAPADPGLAPNDYHIDEKLLVNTNFYSTGTDYGAELQNTYFDQGEGWTGTQLNLGQSADYTLTGIQNMATSSGLPQLEVLLVGRGMMDHRAEIYAGGRLLTTVTFSVFNTQTVTQDIAWSDIAGSSLTVRVRVIGVAASDRLCVSYVRLRYPQTIDAANATEKIFRLAASGTNVSNIAIQRTVAGTRLFDITDPDNVGIISTTPAGATLKASVPGTTQSRKLLATTLTATAPVRAVSFREITPTANNFVIISHPLLRTPAGGYADPVKAYGGYRASAEGGGYDTIVVNIDQLYDQFNYGEKSPRAIFQCMKYFAQRHLPRYLFLIGKGLDASYAYNRGPTPFKLYKDLVPSSGMPGSDAYYTVGLAGTTHSNAVATGRLTAMKPDDVAAYLNKVIETEARPFDDLTRKHILHLSGGIEVGEPERFRGFLEDFARIAKTYYLGGRVSAIAKHSVDIELINIATEVNKGLGLVTFFGHSSPSTLDFDIGFVTDPIMGYNNPGKYPMLLMNGCNAGSFFLYSKLFGEDWVMAPRKGAAGFIAHSSYGFVSNLRSYTETVYEVGFGDSTYIYKGIGDIQREAARRYVQENGDYIGITTQGQQMILLGDPAVPLFGAPKPDLEINNNNFFISSFDGGPVTTQTDSFAVRMIVRNFGRAQQDTIRIEVKRYLQDNSVVVYDSLYPSALYSDTLTLVVRKGRESGGGNNRFDVTIDPENVLAELNENNNSASIEWLIPLNGTRNLFPGNFSIVHTASVDLAWQATDLLSGKRSFIVEVDTAYTFDSPYKKQFTLEGTVLARQTWPMLTADTLVYYWRTKLAEPLAGENDAWTTTSFTYIEDGPEGWAQVEFPQYLENAAEGLVQNATARRLSFRETVTPFAVRNMGSSYPGGSAQTVSVKIAGAEYNLFTQGFSCRMGTLNLIAFDRRSTVPYIGVPFTWRNRAGRACGREPWVINSFTSTEMVTGKNDDLIKYVDNIAPGDSVLLYTMGNASYNLWPAAAKAKLGELGLSLAQLNVYTSGEPMIAVGRKGLAPGKAKVYRATGTPLNQKALEVSGTITGGYSSGSMQTALIGPAVAWNSFVFDPEALAAADVAVADIRGVKLTGEETPLWTGLTTDQDLTGVDATQYPYLRIIYHTADDVNLTPVQLRQWLVLYTPAPEGLLVYRGEAIPHVLNEGDAWPGAYSFVNISDKTFSDSLTVQYELFNQDQRFSQRAAMKIAPPPPGDTTHFIVSIPTADRQGLNDVNVYVNPHILPEQYYENNLLGLPGYLNVRKDMLNPVLAVTIDGRHVENGDFVSANPLIAVRIWDENRIIRKTTPEGIRMFLTYPCATEPCTPVQVTLESDSVTWQSATATTDFTLQLTPRNLPDGKYTLQVEAADARDNSSGGNPYLVTFTVTTEEALTVSEPYPNPSYGDVYFRVVLSGQTLPGDISLDIIDVNGKQVAVFPREAFADFHIGVNRLRWDGRDLAGNVLPVGVYIYRLRIATEKTGVSRNGKILLRR